VVRVVLSLLYIFDADAGDATVHRVLWDAASRRSLEAETWSIGVVFHAWWAQNGTGVVFHAWWAQNGTGVVFHAWWTQNGDSVEVMCSLVCCYHFYGEWLSFQLMSVSMDWLTIVIYIPVSEQFAAHKTVNEWRACWGVCVSVCVSVCVTSVSKCMCAGNAKSSGIYCITTGPSSQPRFVIAQHSDNCCTGPESPLIVFLHFKAQESPVKLL